jgi:hypothetical protein
VTLLERAVFDAALALTDVKREAQKVFRTGLNGMPALVRDNPVARMLADRTSAAGTRLEKAVDEYRRNA